MTKKKVDNEVVEEVSLNDRLTILEREIGDISEIVSQIIESISSKPIDNSAKDIYVTKVELEALRADIGAHVTLYNSHIVQQHNPKRRR